MLSPIRLDVDPFVLGSPWPISEALIKQHDRIDLDDDDALLEIYLRAAIAWAENTTHRTIFRREHRFTLREFPRREIRLPRGKTQSISGIVYSSGGQAMSMFGASSGSPTGTDYQEFLGGDEGAILMPPRGGDWPSADCDVPAPVTITFTAGWDVAAVPADIIHSILFAVGDFYDMRGTLAFDANVIGVTGQTMIVRELLISPYRLSRWY